MPSYAYIRDDVVPGQSIVWEIINTANDVKDHFAAGFHANLIDVTGRSPVPQQGWYATNVNGLWSFSPPPIPVLTLTQQAQRILASGIQVASMSNPGAINGTYPLDAETRSDLQAEMLSLLANGVFTNGGSTISISDTSGAQHEMSVAQFRTFVTAIGKVVTTLKGIASTGTGTMPSQPLSIA